MSAQASRYIGSLTCTISGGQGFVLGRTRDLACNFEPFQGSANQGYKGSITRFGPNLGAADGKVVMVWSVFSSDDSGGRPRLTGKYRGITGSTGVPMEMSGLVGGLDNRYILRAAPNRANAAPAIAEIKLIPVRPHV